MNESAPKLETSGNEAEIRPENLDKGISSEQILTPEEKITGIDQSLGQNNESANLIARSNKETLEKLKAVEESLGLPHQEETPPSVEAGEAQLNKLEKQKEELEKQKELLVSEQERQRMIEEEKQKILQEKIGQILSELGGLQPESFQKVLTTGRSLEGGNYQTSLLNSLNPGSARSLARAFSEGAKTLAEFIDKNQNIISEFDAEITKEAEKKVDEKIEEMKNEFEDKQEKTLENKEVEEKEIDKTGEVPIEMPTDNKAIDKSDQSPNFSI